VVEMTVATLGTIRNAVVPGTDAPAIRQAPRHDWKAQRSN
jgi:hypothetical protein